MRTLGTIHFPTYPYLSPLTVDAALAGENPQ